MKQKITNKQTKDKKKTKKKTKNNCAPGEGLEPSTTGLKGLRSTD